MEYIEERNLYRFTVIGTDTDVYDSLHYHSLCSMLQEAACYDADRQGYGASVLDELQACWLILRMKIVMEQIPKWREEIYIHTKSNGYQKVFFNRDFEILDADFKRIGWATSIWVITEKDTHRPIRPNSIPGMEAFVRTEPFERTVDKLFPVDENLRQHEGQITRFADFSDIDRNMHVNNTRYVAWTEDCVYRQISMKHAIQSLSIHYASEVKMGEEVKVYCFTSLDHVQVDGFEASQGRHVFSARVELCDSNLAKE